MTTDWLKELVGAYFRRLGEDAEVAAADNGWLVVATPFLGAFNDALEIYARRDNGKILLSDDGETLRNLELQGCAALGDARRTEFVSVALRSHGVALDRKTGELLTEADAANFPERLHGLLSAMLEMHGMGMAADWFAESPRRSAAVASLKGSAAAGGAGEAGGKVFIYWDNSNIFHGAGNVAGQREGAAAKKRVRINFNGLMLLARAGREMGKAAVVAASVPPAPRSQMWSRMAAPEGVQILEQFDRRGGGEQEVPDHRLQLKMLGDALDFAHAPGVAVLLTGDGKPNRDGEGFYRALKRMRKIGWRVELLSWKRDCNRKMRRWVESCGVFVPLDDHYDAVTFLEAARDSDRTTGRRSAPWDPSRRPVAE